MRSYILIILMALSLVICGGQTVMGSSQPLIGVSELVKVEKGHSRLVRMPGKPRRVSVADQKVADVLVIAPDQLYINGRKVGTTNITVWGKTNGVMAQYEVKVGRNLTLLKKKMAQLLPGENIAVHEMEGVVVLSGRVTSKMVKEQAGSLAAVFSTGPDEVKDEKSASGQAAKTGGAQKKDTTTQAADMGKAFAEGLQNALGGGKKKGTSVRNLLEVGDQKQIMLKLKFAEVKKDVLRRMGINLGFANGMDYVYTFVRNHLAPRVPNTLSSSQAPGDIFGLAFGSMTSAYRVGDILGMIDMLKQDGSVQVLAEPNLVCVSGESAEFLAGGEFPVPVPSDSNITIYFKPYGVQLKFTPLVLSDGRIRLKVAPEVSDPDFDNVVEISGYIVPGVTTRKAKTVLELNNGQSFALAGLLKRDLDRDNPKVSFFGRHPGFGQPFPQQHVPQQGNRTADRGYAPYHQQKPAQAYIGPKQLCRA